MERATYRVYTPRDLSSIPPSTLKSHRSPRSGLGWSGFFFLVVIGVMIGGSSYAALRVVKPDAHATTNAFGVGIAQANDGKPPETVLTGKPADVTTTLTPMAAAEPDANAKNAKPAPSAKPVVAAPKPFSLSTIKRAPVNPQPKSSAKPATPDLPPNPFNDPN